MKVLNKQITHTHKGYKKVTGNIYTTKKITLINPQNNGKSPFDPSWNNNDYLEIPVGTFVDYVQNVNHMGTYHNISLTENGIKFCKTVLL